MFACFYFCGVFFVKVAQLAKLEMTKQSVIVKVHFRIQRNQTIVFRKQERIDLDSVADDADWINFGPATVPYAGTRKGRPKW